MGLNTLPYDLLLNIASYLELRDIHALHLVSSLSLTCFFAFLFFLLLGWLFGLEGWHEGDGLLQTVGGWVIGGVGGVTSFSFAGDRITWERCERFHWVTSCEAFEE